MNKVLTFGSSQVNNAFTMNKPHPDAAVIAALGGPAKLARRLGYDTSAGGINRVSNWGRRGIPPQVRIDHPEVFADYPPLAPEARAA